MYIISPFLIDFTFDTLKNRYSPFDRQNVLLAKNLALFTVLVSQLHIIEQPASTCNFQMRTCFNFVNKYFFKLSYEAEISTKVHNLKKAFNRLLLFIAKTNC